MREVCLRCRKARITCYCHLLRPFEAGLRFVILMHPREARNPVGTGRMVHLSVTNSLLLQGHDFSRDERVEALIADPRYHAAVLYPGRNSLNLSSCAPEEIHRFTPAGRQLLLFVVDGTWDLARGMINRSPNLKALPQLSFTPESRSDYRIREQPEAHCLSTLEAVHWLVERFHQLGSHAAPSNGEHHGLLEVFRHMVSQQIEFAARNPSRTEGLRQRAP